MSKKSYVTQAMQTAERVQPARMELLAGTPVEILRITKIESGKN